MEEVEIIFLGSGGGRFSTITQKRHTGGIRFIRPINMQLDPGPGAIVYSNQLGLDPSKVRAVVISHGHPDHYCDAEIFIEAMTQGGTKKRGYLVCSRSVLKGNDVCEASVSKYHQNIPEKVFPLAPEEEIEIENVKIIGTSAKHSDPDTVGFRFKFSSGDVGYTSDTEYFEGVGKQYEGARLLILSLIRPRGAPLRWHMCSDDAVKILREAKPEHAIITHFGMKMIFANPGREAQIIESETKIPVTAATDNMRVLMGEELRVEKEKMRPSLNHFVR